MILTWQYTYRRLSENHCNRHLLVTVLFSTIYCVPPVLFSGLFFSPDLPNILSLPCPVSSALFLPVNQLLACCPVHLLSITSLVEFVFQSCRTFECCWIIYSVLFHFVACCVLHLSPPAPFIFDD